MSTAIDYQAYLDSPEWQTRRELSLRLSAGNSLDLPKCEACDYRGKSLDVHHLHYRTFGHESTAALIVLCRECHDLAHAEQDYRRKCEMIAAERERHLRTVKALRLARNETTYDALMRGEKVSLHDLSLDWLRRYGHRR